ncbi:hypothetical protein JCM11251_007319 [Rhodosporidiobolus azoricus]
MQPATWPHHPPEPPLDDPSLSILRSQLDAEHDNPAQDWQGGMVKGQEHCNGGHTHQQQYEPHPQSSSAPTYPAYSPQHQHQQRICNRRVKLASLQPSAAANGSLQIASSGGVADDYGVSSTGRAYFDVSNSGGRKRGYEESFGEGLIVEGNEGEIRGRRVPSGVGMALPSHSNVYSASPSTPGVYSSAENGSPVVSSHLPFQPSPSPNYHQTSFALSQPPPHSSPFVHHTRAPSNLSHHASTSYLPPSSSYPASTQAPAETYEPSYERFDPPASSRAPAPLATYSFAHSRSAVAYQSPQPSPSLPTHLLPHRFQQPQHQSLAPSNAAPHQSHPAAPFYKPSPQRAFSVDAASHPYHFPSPYRRQRSPSAGSLSATRPATSDPHSPYGVTATSYNSSPYSQATPVGYGSAPRVTSQTYESFSSGPSPEAVDAPSPIYSQRPSFDEAARVPPAIRTFSQHAAPISYESERATHTGMSYPSVYSQPQEQQDWLQASQPYQPQEEQHTPFPTSAATGVYYTPAPSTARPSISDPSPTYSSFSHSTMSSQPPLSSSLPPSAAPCPSRQPTPPQILPSSIYALRQASTARIAHRTSAPVFAFNPAREPASSAKQRVQSEYGTTYLVASSGQNKGKAKSAEVPAACWSCQTPRAKVILRGSDLTGFAPRLSFTCLDCLPVEETGEAEKERGKKQKEKERLERLAAKAEVADRVMLGLADEEENVASSGGAGAGSSFEATASPAPPPLIDTGEASASSASRPGANLGVAPALPSLLEHDRLTFKDSFSGAVDYLEGRPGAGTGKDGSRIALMPEETKSGLPAHLKRQALTCDVCDRIVGAGSISSLTPGPVPTFSVEVICYPCEDKYRPCSDCGGGGGRLTPGRWRCKELFPAGRRTCTLSHARNPPLDDIEYDVLRVTEIDLAKLDSLENRCRLIYFNTRLRTQARPEMLERADGLATTYAQCEKLTVDGWSLLKPMLSEDVEPARNLRRYVAVQTSTPHRRRSKPKPGAAPKPEPVEEEPAEKEVSGFILLEHDFEKGAIFIAVTMPWAIAGDAFDATTVLMDECFKRIRSDVHELNAAREREGFEPYPEPWCVWGITPFKADSRMTQSLSRRGLDFLEDYVATRPQIDMTCFPPHREIHIPNEFVKAFKIFIRSVTAEDGIGAPPASVGGKVTGAKSAKVVKPRKSRATSSR